MVLKKVLMGVIHTVSVTKEGGNYVYDHDIPEDAFQKLYDDGE